MSTSGLASSGGSRSPSYCFLLSFQDKGLVEAVPIKVRKQHLAASLRDSVSRWSRKQVNNTRGYKNGFHVS